MAEATTMDTRQQRAMEMVNNPKIRQKGNLWLVPSQTGKGEYTVNLESEIPHCTCRDHEFRRATCKHFHAVLIVVERTKTVTTTTKIEEGKPAVTKTVSTVAQPSHHLADSWGHRWSSESYVAAPGVSRASP